MMMIMSSIVIIQADDTTNNNNGAYVDQGSTPYSPPRIGPGGGGMGNLRPGGSQGIPGSAPAYGMYVCRYMNR